MGVTLETAWLLLLQSKFVPHGEYTHSFMHWPEYNESSAPLTKLSKNDQLLAFNSINPGIKFMIIFLSHGFPVMLKSIVCSNFKMNKTELRF